RRRAAPEAQPTMTRILRALLLASLSSVAIPLSSIAQETPKDTPLKVQTTLVSVPVIVSDRSGRYLSGLKAGDFRLYQDKVEQPVSVFDAVEEPLNVALLIDTSISTIPVLDDIKKAGERFLRELRTQDRAMIVAVDYDVHVLCQLTSD